MGIKIDFTLEIIYFKSGFYIEHMRALYHIKERLLTIVSLKHLPKILQLLEKFIDADDKGRREISIEWYK